MKKILVLLSSVILAQTVSALDLDDSKRRCGPALPNEPIVYSSDFSWNVTFEEMKRKFAEIYQTDKRLTNRAYYDASLDSFVLPFKETGKLVKIGDTFLRSVTRHIERALQLRYINFVFFPDMGHSHINIPQGFYDRELDSIEVKDFNLLYEKIFAEPSVKFLYHTAEQLKMLGEDDFPLADRFLQWRLYTRSLVGYNDGGDRVETMFEPSSKANAASSEPGYRYWGGGFNIHSSKNGCFSYQDGEKTYYFDISLEDLPQKNIEF